MSTELTRTGKWTFYRTKHFRQWFRVFKNENLYIVYTPFGAFSKY